MPQQATTRPVNAQAGVQTLAELEALVRKRGELQDQMKALARRRDQIAEQAHAATDAGAKGELQARLKEIDQRTARIDADLLRLDDQIAEAVGRGVGASPTAIPTIAVPPITIPPFGQSANDMRFVAGALAAEALAFVLLGFAFWQFGLKRMRAQFTRAFADQTRRLEQVQQALAVIGVEVERVSEGQRYVAKVLTEGPQSLGAGEARPVELAEKRGAPVRMGDAG
jgi:hypothetical protein